MVRLISPRSELIEVTRRLAAFQYFHPKEEITPEPDKKLEYLLSNLRRLSVEMHEVATELSLKDEISITEQLLKGYNIEKTVISIKDWEELAEYIASRAEPLLAAYKELRIEFTNLEKEVRERTTGLLSLKGLEELNYDLERLEGLRWVRVYLFTTPNRNVPELKRALSDLIVRSVQIGPENSLVLVAGPSKDTERINRTMRVFDAKPITIPRGAPPNPSEAFRQLSLSLMELTKAQRQIKEKLEVFAKERGRELLTLKEAAKLALSNLERLRKPKGFRRVVVVEGFVPYSKLSEFRKKMSKWLIQVERSGVEEYTAGGEESQEPRQPTMLRNRRYFRAFEKITLTQGPPLPGELDPTPLIAFIFPLFYGLMFGDIGHGVILTLFGLFLLRRTAYNLRPWATMIVAFGVSATISGALVGEFFGLHTTKIPLLGKILEPVHALGLHIGLTVESESIPRLLGLSIIVGVFHLSLGFALDIIKKMRLGDKYGALTMSLPTFIWYVLGAIPFGVGLIQVNIDLSAVGTSELPHLIFPFMSVGEVTNYIVVPVTLASSFAIILSHPLGVLLHKHHGSLGDAFILGPIEWLFRVIEFLANTISYVRLGILLLIHATLVSVIRTFTYDDVMLLPAALIFNLLVIGLEGLIVYIQALRLHLYEWFTKFYEGGGRIFEGLTLEGQRVRIQLLE